MAIRFKICGLTTESEIDAVAAAGAAYVGLNFFPRSPRFVDIERARALALRTPVGVAKVALVVNAEDADLDGIIEGVPVDIIQLHGNESPERVAEVKDRHGLPVMKALGVADEDDLPALEEFGRVADMILVDAKPPRDAVLPGGNGLPFDWRLIAGRRWPVPWMLAGGLTAQNVGEAIRLTGASQVDVSSGVESAPGVKDAAMIEAFARAATCN